MFCSSLAAAGPARHSRPVNETDDPLPVSAYGSSKLIAERIVEESKLDHLIVRPPVVYGPRDADLLAVFRLAFYGLAFRLAPPGQQLSLIHVQDLARGFVEAVEEEGRGTYYMSDGMVHTWESVMNSIARAVGKIPRSLPLPAVVAAAIARAEQLRTSLVGGKPLLTQGRIAELSQNAWTCDDTRARLDLNYESVVALPEGMRMTADWYRQNGWLRG